MPIAKRIISYIVLACVSAAIFLYSAFWLVPSSIIEERARDAAMAAYGLSLSMESFGKAFPLGFEARGVRVSRPGVSGELARIEKLRLDVSLLSVLAGRLGARVEGGAGGGAFTGNAYLAARSSGAELDFEGVGLEAFPVAAIYAGKGGALSGRLSVTKPRSGCAAGRLSAKAHGIGANISIKGLPVNLGDVSDSGIEAAFRDCMFEISGAWVEGSSLAIRLSGAVDLKAGAADALIELTAKDRGSIEGVSSAVLAPYKKSANYYSARIRGDINRPSISAQ